MRRFLLPALVIAASAIQGGAETFLSDTFDYPEGELYGHGQWVRYGAKESNPIRVTDHSLSLPGYAEPAAGKAVMLANINGAASSQVLFRQAGEEPFTGTIYYAALIRVENHPSSNRAAALMCLTGSNAYDPTKFGDGVAGSEGGGLFTRQGSTEGTYNVGISRGVAVNGNIAAEITWAEEDLAIGSTHLIIVSYTTAEGPDNDTMKLWIDPTEADEADETASTESVAQAEETLSDIRGFELSQRSSLSAKMPDTIVDEVRVADSWSELFHSGGNPDDKPMLTLSSNKVEFGRVYNGLTYTRTVRVSGVNLTSDVTATPGASGLVSLSRSVLPLEEVTSAEGAELTLTLTVADSRFSSENVTIASDGAPSRNLNVSWSVVPSEQGTTLREFYDEETHDMSTVYVYTGHATITFIDTYYDPIAERVVNSIFAEDGTAAIEIRSAAGCGYDEVSIEGLKEGDVLTGLVGNLIFSDGGVIFIPRAADAYTVAEHGEPLEPREMTLNEIFNSEPQDVMYSLVTVPDVRFLEKYLDGGDFYGTFNSQKYQIYDEEGTMGWMWRFNGADYRDKPTSGYFDSIWNLTGIVCEMTPITIGPRSLADFDFVSKIENSGVENVVTDNGEKTVKERYDLQGRPAGNGTRGLVIEILSDGSARKAIRH